MMLHNQERLYRQLPASPREQIVHHRGNRLVLFAVLAVACVFFCHLSAGPWSAVNGPATALQAARYALTIFLLIALAAFHCALLYGQQVALTNPFVSAMAELETEPWPLNLGAVPIRC